jgi:dTDP-4-amino-4,6-dideoxygalactose transaminase
MSIPVFRSYIRRKDMDTVLSCLVTDSVGPGDYLDRFQKGARELFGYDFGFAVRSPFTALSLALEALGLEDGDAIALSALSPAFYASVINGRRLDARYLDVSIESGIPTRENVDAIVSGAAKKPKAILLGGGCGVLPDPELFSDVGIPIIEDFTRSLGGTRNGSPAAAIGSLGIIGLEHGSMITAGGGAILFALAKREGNIIRNLSESLLPELRMTDFNAALGLAQLRDFEAAVEKRKEIRRIFAQSIAGSRQRMLVQVGEAEAGCWSFPVVLESSVKEARAYAKKKEVDTDLAFEDSCMGRGLASADSCPNARSLTLRTLLFPLHQRIGANGAQKISRVLATLP